MSGGRSGTRKPWAGGTAGQSGTDAFVCQPAADSKKKDDRRYPKRPIIGVGALIFRRGRILMAQRGKQPLKGAWSLPGGALEIGESLDAAHSPRSARGDRT